MGLIREFSLHQVTLPGLVYLFDLNVLALSVMEHVLLDRELVREPGQFKSYHFIEIELRILELFCLKFFHLMAEASYCDEIV